MSSDRRPVRRALISVDNKSGLVELGRGLAAAGIEIVSTGSTARGLEDEGVPVTPVSSVTGFPELLDGRVKTLHPAIHAAILADQANPRHARQLEDGGIKPFELVVANLYPFQDAVASGATPEECIEKIDIGGVTLLRAAAKNHGSVAVVVDPARYPDVLASVERGGFDSSERRRLAAEAFAHTAAYEVAIASWFASSYAPDEPARESGWPDFLAAVWQREQILRYGENPHQRAALYATPAPSPGPGLAQAEQLHGKHMSFNNYVDADAAWRAAHDFAEPCVAIIKHANPCGIGLGRDLAEAYGKAHACDPVSAFGGVIATNRPVSLAMADLVAEVVTDVVLAPDYDDGALDVLTRKKNIRLLRCASPDSRPRFELRQVTGGLLVQGTDLIDADGDDPDRWTLEAGAPVDEILLADLAFAWRAIRAVKSNAILVAADRATVGIGMGQVNRVDAARLAVRRAGERSRGAVAASDAYFPFPDGLEVLSQAGVRAIVAPGGSMRDPEVIEAARRVGVSLYFTGTRHFLH